jgi:hypothetical protein
MAVYSGKDGQVEWVNTKVTRVRNWSLESSFDTLEVTDLGDDARAYVAGLKSATGSMTVFYHDDDASLSSILDNVITTGTPTAGKLELLWGAKQITVNAFINTASITCSTGEVMSAELGFTVTGDYTSYKL